MMTAANAATVTNRPISASNPSAHHAGGSGTGSGLKGIIRRSRCSSSDQGAIDVEVLTDRSRSDVAGCSRAHLGAYLRSLRIVTRTTHNHPRSRRPNLKYDQKMTAPGQIPMRN